MLSPASEGRARLSYVAEAADRRKSALTECKLQYAFVLVTRRSIIFRTESGSEPYVDYVDSLKDREGAAKIWVRVARAESGKLGDHRSVGHGVVELRIDSGPGYRIYVGLHGKELIVLLCAGDKGSQDKDIRRAHGYWDEYREAV